MNQPRESLKSWKKVNVWSIKGPVFALALVIGFLSAAHQWSHAPFVAAIAMAIPMIGFRDFWGEGRFWLTVGLLGFVQVLLVIEVGTIIEQRGFPYLFVSGVLDCAFVIATIYSVCSERSGNER